MRKGSLPAIAPGTGNFPAAAAQINGNIDLLNRGLIGTTGMGRLVMGTAGDSISAYENGSQENGNFSLGWGSATFQMRSRFYDADFTLNTIGSEWGFAVGGTNTAHLLNNQVPLIQQRMAVSGARLDVIHLSCYQNNGVTTRAGADSAFNEATQAVTAMLNLGLTVIWAGVIPYKGMTGADRAASLDYLNAKTRAWCAARSDVYYIDRLAVLKDLTPSATEVTWAGGNPGAIGSVGIDTAHIGPMGGRVQAPLFADIYSRLFGKHQYPDFAALPFDNDKNPFGNYIGEPGMFLGTGGTINGASGGGKVASGWDLQYDATKGVTVTPEVIVGADGYRRQRIGVSGTPTADGTINLVRTMSYACDAGLFSLYMKAKFNNVSGVSGVAGTTGGSFVGSTGYNTHVIPGSVTEEYSMRSVRPKAFSNSFNGQTATLSVGLANGTAVSGSVDFWRVGFVRVGDI